MSATETKKFEEIRMDKAGEIVKLQTEDGGPYEIVLPPTDYLILVMGVDVGSPGETFDAPTVASRTCRIFEFKHYRRDGGKRWTRRAGVEYCFVVPKSAIHLIKEPGYSYVSIRVAGVKYNINCSGGTGNGGWTDWVRPHAHIGCGQPLKNLKKVAAVAWTPEECKQRGITADIEGLSKGETTLFESMSTAANIRGNLRAGQKLVLAGCSWQGKTTLTILSVPGEEGFFRRRQFICADADYPTVYKVRVKYSQIDWVKTAAVNGLPIVAPNAFNRIGEIKPPKWE